MKSTITGKSHQYRYQSCASISIREYQYIRFQSQSRRGWVLTSVSSELYFQKHFDSSSDSVRYYFLHRSTLSLLCIRILPSLITYWLCGLAVNRFYNEVVLIKFIGLDIELLYFTLSITKNIYLTNTITQNCRDKSLALFGRRKTGPGSAYCCFILLAIVMRVIKISHSALR